MKPSFLTFDFAPHLGLIDDEDLYKQPILDLILAALVKPNFRVSEQYRPRLNNHDIVKLIASRVSVQVIVRIIEVCESEFEMSSRSLSLLRKCGVSERIIEAVLLKECRRRMQRRGSSAFETPVPQE